MTHDRYHVKNGCYFGKNYLFAPHIHHTKPVQHVDKNEKTNFFFPLTSWKTQTIEISFVLFLTFAAFYSSKTALEHQEFNFLLQNLVRPNKAFFFSGMNRRDEACVVPFPATNFPSPVQRRKWQGANCSRDEGGVLTAPREGRTQLTNPSLMGS